MKLERLRTLHEELKKELVGENITWTIFYFHENIWKCLDGVNLLPEGEGANLDKALKEDIAHHLPSRRAAWFSLKRLDCVVSLTFPTSPQINTRRRYRATLDTVQQRALNSYQVSHNTLTELLARDAFRSKLKVAIESIDAERRPAIETQVDSKTRALAVLALDIDHFKQVNDTYGHLYGDQVLKIFGIRLEGVAKKLLTSRGSDLDICLGHPSGEEFLIFVEGRISRDEILEIANAFRSGIADDILPTEREWDFLCQRNNLSALMLPALQDRSITTSVGVVIHADSMVADSAIDSVSYLLDRADTALYRAKAAGRNVVVLFDEIRARCGRVIEQDSQNGVIAIDIGSNVGVANGQEFKVFPPAFTGAKKFSINDGRTTRIVGYYPRVELTRITVFNVQMEIAFAFISNPQESAFRVEVGSHLEAIPVGSIGHLLPHSSKFFPSAMDAVQIGDSASLQQFMTKASESKIKPWAVVLRFAREQDYYRKYGSASLNIALARLYRAAMTAFHVATSFGIIDRGSVCVAGFPPAYKEDLVVKLADELGSELPELGLVAGVFCPADVVESASGLRSKLDSVHAIEFARFAASDHAQLPDSRVMHFSHVTAIRMLNSLRESRSYAVALADFERLRELGVESPELLNQGGLISSAQGMWQQAAELFEAAAAKDPKVLIYKSNFATACSRPDDVDRALKLLNELKEGDVEFLYSSHAYGFVTYARLLAKAKLAGSPLFNTARFILMAKRALEHPEYRNRQELDVIRMALIEAPVPSQ